MKKQFHHGVWTIEDEALHLDIPKLLNRLALEDTPDNRDLAVKTALEVASEAMPNLPIIVTTNL